MKADFIPSSASRAAAAATRRDSLTSPGPGEPLGGFPAGPGTNSPSFPRAGSEQQDFRACRSDSESHTPGRSFPSCPRCRRWDLRADFPRWDARAGRGEQREQSSPAEPGTTLQSPAEPGARCHPARRDAGMCGCRDGLFCSETSTWPPARAGSGDTAIAPPAGAARCPNTLRDLPSHPTLIPIDNQHSLHPQSRQRNGSIPMARHCWKGRHSCSTARCADRTLV